jgi:hypothetical protein
MFLRSWGLWRRQEWDEAGIIGEGFFCPSKSGVGYVRTISGGGNRI